MKRPPALLTALCALALLSGCAYAPGLSLGNSLKAGTPQGGPYATQAGPAADGTSTATGELLSITPELIRQQQALRQADVPAEVRALLAPAEAQAYRIAPLDVLSIVVWGHPEFSPSGLPNALPPATGPAAFNTGVAAPGTVNGFVVEDNGAVNLPLVGNQSLAGMTCEQARAHLVTLLGKYFKNPAVTVRVQTYRGQRVYVNGEVVTRGLQVVDDVPMTLAELLGRAGGMTPQADPSAIAITREGRTTMVSLPSLVANGLSPARLLLKPGDLVQVRSREDAKVFVIGEVLKSGSQFLRDGRLTLNEALGDAGGISPNTGDPRQIYVIRNLSGDKAQIFHLDGRTATAYALAEGFELRSRDVVFVDAVPLVNWNRVINLILPSAQAVYTSRTAVGTAN